MATRSINATLDRFILDAGTEITYLGMSLWKGAPSDLIRAYRVTPGLNGYVIFTIEKSFGVLDMEIYQEDAYNSLSPLTGYSKYFSVLKAGKLKGAIGVNVRYDKTYIVLVRFETYQNAFYSGKVRIEDPLYLAAGATPALDLQFANNQSLVDVVSKNNLVTFTRASTGTYVDSTGTLQTAAVNAPRFTYDPVSGQSLGLLVEEQRTNSIRNNTMVGAVAGTPGTLPTNWTTVPQGLTQTVVGSGIINGVSYVDIKFTGTTTGAGGIQVKPDGNAGVITATSSQAWTLSAWVSIIAGSTANTSGQRFIINEYSAGPTYLRTAVAATNVLSSGSILTRVSGAITTGASTTIIEPIIILDVASGAAIDITLRIGMPQLEQGAFATSVIPTTSAAATRNADVASITGTAFSSWYRQDEGTVFAETQLQSTAARTVAGFDINDNSTNNRIVFRAFTSSSVDQVVIRSGSTTIFSATNVAPAPTTAIRKTSAGYKANDFAYTAAGQAGYTGTSGAVPVSPTQILIGYEQGPIGYLGGTIRRLVYWGSRLSNNTLQAITQ